MSATNVIAAHRYVSPVVIQRFAGRADPSVPGFYGGAEIWIMEDDGSQLRRVRSSAPGHLDHPTLTADLQHVVYSEFDDPSAYVAGTAALFKEHLYSGQRMVLRSFDRCSIHHNTISPVDHVLSYMVSGPDGHRQVTEVDGQMLTITERSATRRLLANAVSMPGRLLLQCEDLPRAKPRHSAIAIYSHADRSVRPVTRTTALHRRPALSPCGTKAAWQSNERDPHTDDLHIADLDGSNHRILTSPGAKHGHPWFSRDGSWILFESDRTGNWEIHKLHLESGRVVQLTRDTAYASTRPRC